MKWSEYVHECWFSWKSNLEFSDWEQSEIIIISRIWNESNFNLHRLILNAREYFDKSYKIKISYVWKSLSITIKFNFNKKKLVHNVLSKVEEACE